MPKPYLIRIAGTLAIIVALVHGISAEFRLFPFVTAAKPEHVLLLRFVWQASTLAWISFGILLIAASKLDGRAASYITVAALFNFAVGSIGGLVATGWTHYGWLLLASICALLISALVWKQ
jgi:hypothetical protein